MGWWRRWLVKPVRDQLVQGASPDKLAWTISAGVVLGIFPIMGSTSLVCLLAGWALKLNQVVLHLFKSLVYPLHLALILVFIRLGELLSGAPLIAFSIPELLARFKDDPLKFAGDFGLAAWHGILAWMLIAPFLAYGIKLAVMPALRALKAKVRYEGDGREMDR
jgi:uncharacterized protein (DUF2062 family)